MKEGKATILQEVKKDTMPPPKASKKREMLTISEILS